MVFNDLCVILKREVPSAYCTLIEQMKFFIEPEISCSRFFAEACFLEQSLQEYRKTSDVLVLQKTELGEFLEKQITGCIFIDVPCGLHAVRDSVKDYDLIPLVHALGSSKVIEVDLTAEVLRDRISQTMDVLEGGKYQLTENIGKIGNREEDGLPVITMQDDLLGFVSKLPDAGNHQPLTIYISALQPDAEFCSNQKNQREIAVPYLMALYDELSRVCGAADIVILNSATMLIAGIDLHLFPEIDPATALFHRGFLLKRRCQYDKVRVYRKE